MHTTRRGLTLLELVVVLVVLVALAALVVPLLAEQTASAKETVSRANMTHLRDVVLGQYRTDNENRLPRPGPSGLAAGRPDRPQTRYLFVNPTRTPEDAVPSFDPVAAKGWRGPYIQQGFGTYQVSGTFTTDYGVTGDPCVMDGWNRPMPRFSHRREPLTMVPKSATPISMTTAMV